MAPNLAQVLAHRPLSDGFLVLGSGSRSGQRLLVYSLNRNASRLFTFRPICKELICRQRWPDMGLTNRELRIYSNTKHGPVPFCH